MGSVLLLAAIPSLAGADPPPVSPARLEIRHDFQGFGLQSQQVHYRVGSESFVLQPGERHTIVLTPAQAVVPIEAQDVAFRLHAVAGEQGIDTPGTTPWLRQVPSALCPTLGVSFELLDRGGARLAHARDTLQPDLAYTYEIRPDGVRLTWTAPSPTAAPDDPGDRPPRRRSSGTP